MRNSTTSRSAASEAAVKLAGIRYGTQINASHLREIAEALTQAQIAIARAAENISAMGNVAANVDLPRINAVLDYVQSKVKPSRVPQPSVPEKGRFALDADTREEIRYRHSIGVPNWRLAEDFGVSRSTIGRYVKTR